MDGSADDCRHVADILCMCAHANAVSLEVFTMQYASACARTHSQRGRAVPSKLVAVQLLAAASHSIVAA